MKKPVFEGLIVDELERSVDVVYVGEDPCYVVDDNGFLRHIPTEHVDLQVFQAMGDMIEGHEDLLTGQTAKMLGQEDIFSRAIIQSQLENIDDQFDALMDTGIPEEMRAYIGMMGFKIRINIHGEVVDIEQPGLIADEDE